MTIHQMLFFAYLAAAMGYISLSSEILWIRQYSIVTGGTAHTFGIVLSFFLIGIALGSKLSKKIPSRYAYTNIISHSFLISGACVLLLPLCSILTLSILDWYNGLLFVTFSSLLMGCIFPTCVQAIANHIDTGKATSIIYFSNIIGSTAGALVTGLVVLDHFNLIGALALTGSLCFANTLFLFFKSKSLGFSLLSIALLVSSVFMLFYDKEIERNLMISERLIYKKSFSNNEAIKFQAIYEDRSASVSVAQDKTVFGSGVYDGKINTSLINDSNGVYRALYINNLMNKKRKKILMIGLSSGSWASILSKQTDIETITIIELSKAYLSLIKNNSQVSELLHSPKVNIIISDGRKWMRSNTQKFDIIFQNTTFHWRSYAGNLLSQEYFKLTKEHLYKEGILAYNTTGLLEAYFTGCSIFKFGYLYQSLALMSESSFENSINMLPTTLRTSFLENDLTNEEALNKIDYIMNKQSEALRNNVGTCYKVRPLAETKLISDDSLITDDNLLNEFTVPWHFAPPYEP